MEILRFAEPRPLPSVRPAALVLAVLVNGGLLTVFALTRQFTPPSDERDTAIDVLLLEPGKDVLPQAPPAEKTPTLQDSSGPVPRSKKEAAPSAPRPGRLPRALNDEMAGPPPALWSLICPQIPEELRGRRPECRQEGDPFAARTGPVTAGVGDRSVRDRPIGDLIGGRFAGKDRYQIEVMLGLRSTNLGTKYHVPVDHGPADEPTGLSNSDDVFGPSPIPDG